MTITIGLTEETNYVGIVTAINSAVQTADCARDATKNGQKGYLLQGVAASRAILEQIVVAMERAPHRFNEPLHPHNYENGCCRVSS